jgi:hypothetical protein
VWSTIRLIHRLPFGERFAPYWLFLVFGLANAILYANIQPLWEGFDEPFHYAFVEHVATHGALPVYGAAHVALDVEESLRLAPASVPVRENLPYVMTFSEYFALPAAERASRRAALWRIPAGWRETVRAGANSNYEAQQAPLAYVALAPLDMLWASAPLPARVLRLRLVCTISAVLLCFGAALAFARLLEMDTATTSLMLLLLVCAQMLYGATAHVANDWLAVSLSAWFFVALARYLQQPTLRAAIWLGALVGAGLLTKAYFLAWAVTTALAVLAMVLRRRARMAHAIACALVMCALAAPWFWRNFQVYGSLSVTQQTMRGIDSSQILRAVLRLDWGETIAAQMRGALWTGNSSFSSFSRSTLNTILVLLAIALVAWLATLRRSRCGTVERWMTLAMGVFGLALAYACAVFDAYSKTGSVHLMSWYPMAISLPLACLASSGLRRSGAAGKWLASALAIGFAYLIVATYAIKLIPQYAGCDIGRVRWRELHHCYVAAGGRTVQLLADTALGPAWVILSLTAVVTILATCLVGVTVRRWFVESDPR